MKWIKDGIEFEGTVDEGKESLVNTYVLKKDAEDMRKECITSSEAINERAIYYIKEVRRQK
jgi:hypothetical protein